MMCNKKLSSHALFVLLVIALWPPLAAASNIYDGTWLNIDPATRGITRADVSSGMFSVTVSVWADCAPTDCYWGQQIVIASSSPFVADYDHGFVVRSLTFDFISQQSLHIHLFNNYADGDPRPDTHYDYYFYRQGYPSQPLPDLIVSQVSIPKPVIEYAATPWTWASFTTKNIGPGILGSGSLWAVISEKIRNGQAMPLSGYLDVIYTAPFEPGDTVTSQFAVGHDLGWPVGSYAVRFHIDSERTVQEYFENNNLSSVLRFDVLQQRWLSGNILHNGNPLGGRADGFSTQVLVRNYATNQYITGYDFWFDGETGHYYLSNLPNVKIYLNIRLYPPDGGPFQGGTIFHDGVIDVPSLTTAAASDFDLEAQEVIHLLQPRDNAAIGNISGYEQCGRVDFVWEPLLGADYYYVSLHQYRDAAHPNGYGFIQTIYQANQTDIEFSIKPANSNPNEHYQFRITAFNAGNRQIGLYMAAGPDWYGWDYRFKTVGQTRSAADINGDCSVNTIDLALLAQHWLENMQTP